MASTTGGNRKREKSIAFAAGIPRFRPSHGSKKQILAMLRPLGCFKCKIPHNHEGNAVGYAWLEFKSDSARDSAIISLGGRLLVDNCLELTLTACINSQRCHGFPFAASDQRMKLLLDEEAIFSLTAQYAANDMTMAVKACLDSCCTSLLDPLINRICIDVTGGGGGNAISFINSGYFNKALIFEINSGRAENLRNNITVMHTGLSNTTNWEVICGDAATYLSSNQINFNVDFIFIDPPWGGVGYTQLQTPHDYQLNANVSITDIACDWIPHGPLKNKIKLLGLKVPLAFDALSLFRKVTGVQYSSVDNSQEHMLSSTMTDSGRDTDDRPLDKHAPSNTDIVNESTQSESASDGVDDSLSALQRDLCLTNINPAPPAIVTTTTSLTDRPHPFRLQCDGSTALLLLAYPPHFLNIHLDQLVQALLAFDNERGNEFHPRFYDWEKDVWVSLRRWKGFKSSPACDVN